MAKDKVEDFYNSISTKYTALLDRAIPRYREMLQTMLDYLPKDCKPNRILELGCGTGNLTEHVLNKFPDSELTLVDISEDMLKECKSKFKNKTSLVYYQVDFKDLAFEVNSFDLIISSIAIHHLEDMNKQVLFRKLYSYLKPNGIFTYADQCKGRTKGIYDKHIQSWRTEAFNLGSSEKDWKTWMNHQEKHDYHASAIEQVLWLENAAFRNTDILWRYLLWTVFRAEK